MRLFILLGSLLVIVLVAALMVPPWVDWDQFRDRFEQQGSKVLGLPVQVKGQTRLRLLPLPSLTFNGLHIGPEDAPLLSAQSFRMDVELAPLLKGEVVVVDMVLDQPLLDLQVDRGGKFLWPTVSDRQLQDFGLNEISMERISVNDGKIRARDARYDREIIFTGLDIVASAKSLSGPWHYDGQLAHLGVRYQLNGSTGLWHNQQPDPTNGDGQAKSGEMRVKLTVKPQDQAYNFYLNGPLKIADRVPSFTGKMLVTPIGEQTREEKADFPRPAEDKALPLKLEADLQLTTGGAVSPAFELAIGEGDDPYKISGTGQALFNEELSFRVKAEGQQIDVNRLSRTSADAGQAETDVEETGKSESVNSESGESENMKGQTLPRRFGTVLSVLEKIPRFHANGAVHLHLPAIVTGNTIIRDIDVDFTPSADGAGWRLRNLEAQFPGRTAVQADGVLTLGENPGYQGDLLVASRQPSGLATWLGTGVTAAVRKLPGAGFSAKVDLSKHNLALTDLEIALGERVLKGQIHRKSREGSRPQLFVKLVGSGVNYDQLAALATMLSGGDEQTGTSLIGSHDLDLELDAETVVASGVTARSVKTGLVYQQGELHLKSLHIADMAGAEISASGRITDYPESPVGELVGRFLAKDPTSFLKLLDRHGLNQPVISRLAQDPASVASTALDLAFGVKPTGYRVTGSGVSGGSSVDFELAGDDINKELEKQALNGRLVVGNEQSSQLLLQLGLPVVALPVGGRGAFRAVVNGIAEQGLKVEGALTLRDGYASAAGTVTRRKGEGGAKQNGKFDLILETSDIDPFIMLSGLPVPGIGQGHGARLSGKLTFDGDIWQLDDATGKVGEADISASLKLDVSGPPRASLSGNLEMSTVALETLAGLVYTDTPVVQDGETTENVSRVSPLLSGLDGALSLTAATTVLPGRLGQAQTVTSQVTIRDGDMNFSDINGSWAGGKVTGDLGFAQSSAARLLNGQLTLKDVDLSALFAASGFAPVASGKASGTGTFESTGKDGAALLAALTGSGTLSVAGGKLEGLDGTAFSKILLAADQTEDKELSENTDELVEQNAFSGAMTFEPVEFVYNISSGVVRAANVRLVNETLDVVGNLRLDLTTGQSQTDGRVTYKAGKQAVAGATPEFYVTLEGKPGEVVRSLDNSLLATYLGLRLSERRQRDFEAQQAEILERQRLQQTARLYHLEEEAHRRALLEEARLEKLRQEEAERKRREEAERKKREEAENAVLDPADEMDRAEQLRRDAVLRDMEEVQRQRLREQNRAREKVQDRKKQANRTARQKAAQRTKQREDSTRLLKRAKDALKNVKKGLANGVVKPVQ